jgi:hypothetical protein
MKGTTPAFRCSRCKHTFELETAAAPAVVSSPQAEHEKPPEQPKAEKELSFSFSPEARTAVASDNPTGAAATAGVEISAPAEKVEDKVTWALNDTEKKDEPPFTMPESKLLPETDKLIDAQRDILFNDPIFPNHQAADNTDNTSNILPMSSYVEQQASIVPYMTVLALLLMGFSLIAALSYANPRVLEGFIKWIPVFGTSVLKNNHLKNGILIQSLRSSYQTIQGNREVFVVSGVALNQNPVVIREVQIAGKVYNQGGHELEHQIVWLGNTISPKIIRGMTLEDIPHLQNLKPLKSFEIPPGDSVPFSIVFLRSSKGGAKDFTCEVIAAGAEA